MTSIILPYNLPRSCDWCQRMIPINEEARNVLLDCKPNYQCQSNVAYGLIKQLICLKCFNWSAEFEDLLENQQKLIAKYFKGSKNDKIK